MKIVTWNIRQGGKSNIQQIVDSLVSHQADLIVLTEYKNNDSGMFLTSELMQKGWPYIQPSLPPNNENGVLNCPSTSWKYLHPRFPKHTAHIAGTKYISHHFRCFC